MSSTSKPQRPGVSVAHQTTGTPSFLKAQNPAAYIQARIDGRMCQCLLDSGAEVSLILSQFVSDKKNLIPDERRLLAANNMTINVDGQTCLPVLINKQRFSATLLVSPNVDKVILGRDGSRKIMQSGTLVTIT